MKTTINSTNQLFPAAFVENVKKILEKHGQIITVVTERRLKTKTSFKNRNIIKRSTFQAQVGTNYENRRNIKEKRDMGIAPTELKGYEWIQYPHILRSISSGQLQCRFYTVNNNFARKDEFYEKGQKIELDEIKDILLASELREQENRECFNLPLQNLVEVK